jgi:hypothetical protein
MTDTPRPVDTIKADCEAARMRRHNARTARDRKQADAARAMREADGYQKQADGASRDLTGLLDELGDALLEQAVAEALGPDRDILAY